MIDSYLIIATFVFLLAGTIKGTVGIGLPIAAVGLLSQVGDVRLAVTLSIIPIVVANIWQVYRSGRFMDSLRTYWLLALVMCVTLFFASLYAPQVPIAILIIALGVMISAFASINLFIKVPKLSLKWDVPIQIFTGLAAGFFGGITAIWGPPILIYFLARKLDKDEFIAATGVMFLLGSFPLLFGYSQSGQFTTQTLLTSSWLVVPTLVGYFVGEQLRKKLPTDRFRTIVLIIFLLIGLNLLRRAFFG